MKKQIKLLPWPNPNWKENPYQKLMYAGLKAHGVQIRSTPLTFSLLRFARPFDWLHLNWPSRIYASGSVEKRQRKYERFVATLRFVKRQGVKLIWTMHNHLPHDTSDAAFHQMAYRGIMELSDLIHVHFPDAAELLAEQYHVPAEKIHLMPHGVYGGYYGPGMAKQASRKQLGLRRASIVLLSFGELKWYKGIDKAIAAFRETDNPALQFLVAGKPADQEMQSLLETAAEEDSRIVVKIGRVEDKHVPLYFSAADAFMLPSNDFFTSGSAMLALTYNLPIIGIPKNHLRTLAAKAFFCPWQPATHEQLVAILNSLDTWLKQVDGKELDALKRQLDWTILTEELSRKLRDLS